MKRALGVGVALAASVAFADGGWGEIHGSYSLDFESAYLSRGKVIEDRPIVANDFDVNVGLGPCGRLGMIHWDYSNLTGHFQDGHRRFVPETDWGVYYGYDWELAEGWNLDTEAMVYWELSHGGRPEDDPTDYEWRLKQSLKTPYLTAFWKVRRNFQPIEYTYYQIGAKRKFAVTEWLNVIPNAYLELGDDACRQKRFGAREHGGYGHGGLALTGELIFEAPISDTWSVHAIIGQFGVVSKRGRDNLHAPHRRDLTYFSLGFTFSF